jgi:hypothetical protein
MNFRLSIFLLTFLLNITTNCFAQTQADAKLWLQKLNEPYSINEFATSTIWEQWRPKGKAYCEKALALLEKEIDNIGSKKLNTQYKILCAKTSYFFWQPYKNMECDEWANQALQQATELNDDYLAAAALEALGGIYFNKELYDKGIFYHLKYISLIEKLQFNKKTIARAKITATDFLYNINDFATCMKYCTDVLNTKPLQIDSLTLISIYNNIALVHRQNKKYDSALLFFNKALTVATQINVGVWVGIVHGNIGNILRLQNKSSEAMPHWQIDVDSSMKYNETGDAGLTYGYISEYLFNNNNRDSAWKLLQKAFALSGRIRYNLMVLYQIKANFFKATQQYDSAFYFTNASFEIEKIQIDKSSKGLYEQTKLLLDFETNANQYKLVQKEKQAEVIKRNFLLLALLIALLTGWLFINRQRLRFKIATQKKQIAENEIASAKAQLQLFTQTLIEKNEQIELLNVQLDTLQQTNENELTSHTILTDDDWNRFKTLFEKVHPQFFEKLKQLAPEITAAEIRLAALIKLNLDNKQMASMQGISVSSIRGNKTRLRQRLNITVENDLDIFIKEI